MTIMSTFVACSRSDGHAADARSGKSCDPTPTVVHGDFEWDGDKAASNASKHEVTFEETVQALSDLFALSLDDPGDPPQPRHVGGIAVRAYLVCRHHSAGTTYSPHERAHRHAIRTPTV